MRSPSLVLIALAAGVIVAAASARQPSPTGALDVFVAGEGPDDRRLNPPRDLDAHSPFHPPDTAEAWHARAADLRRQIQVGLGLWPWPERTTLNPRIHQTARRDGYEVDAVSIESVPGHFVTGSLYRPTGRTGRLPAVLSPHGHWPGGRFQDSGAEAAAHAIATGAEPFESAARHPLQARAVHLARLGAVVFLFDLVGYADSVQVPEAVAHGFKAERPHMHGVRSWGFFSPQAELRLQSIMGLQAWNAMRALDYLASRADVDPARIGVTGASGGGTQTFILGALDQRPAALFPAVMVSTGMQGGCTCENASYLRIGTGNVEIAALAAPRPVGMTAADDWTRGFEHDGYPDLRRLFALVGAPDHVRLSPFVQFPHNYNAPSRAAMYDWFNHHLRLGFAEVPREQPFVPLTRDEATVWTAGRAAPPSGEAYERSLLQEADASSARALQALAPRDAASFARYQEVVGGAFDVLLGGRLRSPDEVRFEERRRLAIADRRGTAGLLRRPSNGSVLPTIVLESRGTRRGVLVWISPGGKASAASDSGVLDPRAARVLDAGYDVLSVDVLGTGELRGGRMTGERVPLVSPRPHAGYTYGYNLPLPAQRTQDVLTALAFARQHAGSAGRVLLFAHGPAAAWAAGGRVLGPSLADRAALALDGFRYASVDRIDAADFLPGAAKYGDVPALLALGAPGALFVWDGRDASGGLELVRAAYAAAATPERFHVAGPGATPDDAVTWLLQ